MATFRACPNCGEHHPPALIFCTECGAAMGDSQVQSLYGSSEHYWTIPDYLKESSRWDRTRDEGAKGSGFAWIGAMLCAIPFLASPTDLSSVAAYGGGISLIVVGLVRMRRSARTLARAGLVANGAALVTLVAILVHLVGLVPTGSSITPVATVNDETLEPSATTAPFVVAGETPMFRGNAEHTGVLSGPAPSGSPALTWRFDAGGEIVSSAASANGLIYFTGKRGDIFAIDAASGTTRWNVHLGDYVLKSSPAISGNTLFVAGGYALFALDAASGRELWKQPIQYAAQSSPVIAGSIVLIASQDGRLYAIDKASGAQIWAYNAEGIILGTPAVSGTLVYVGTDSGVMHAVRIETGRFVWKQEVAGGIVASPAVANDIVVIESRGGSVTALDTLTGEQRWEYGIAGESSVAIQQGVVVAGSADGGIHAIDLATGEPLWLFPTGSPVLSSPVIVDTTIYVASGLNLYAIDLTTGNGIWRYSTTDVVEASPAVANGQIYIGSRDGFLYSIGGSGSDAPPNEPATASSPS